MSRSRTTGHGVVTNPGPAWNPFVEAWDPFVEAWNPLVEAWNPLVEAWNPSVEVWDPCGGPKLVFKLGPTNPSEKLGP